MAATSAARTSAAGTSAAPTPSEETLHGGNTNVVVRVGDTVRRQTGHWTPAVHALLAHLQSVGFADAPTVLGIDDQGREILPFVIGEVVSHHDSAPYNTIRRPDGGLTSSTGTSARRVTRSRIWPSPAGPGHRCGATGQPSSASSAMGRSRHPRCVLAQSLRPMARTPRTAHGCLSAQRMTLVAAPPSGRAIARSASGR